MAEERLQKVLAGAGVASRRACEELITAGRVTVNGRTITELGTKVDPEKVALTVDGKPVELPRRSVYIKLHKPRGMLSDIGGDTRGRETVADLVPNEKHRVFPVGRLDLISEGLVLLTDDGALAHRLTHPRFEHPKTYYVLVSKRPPESALNQLRRGIDLPEGRTAPAEVNVVNRLPEQLTLGTGPQTGCWLEIVLREGKKRQIRHMTAAVDYPTLRLVRWAIGPLILGGLKEREAAYLTQAEVSALKKMAESAKPGKASKSGNPSRRTTSKHSSSSSRNSSSNRNATARNATKSGRSSSRPSGTKDQR